MTIRTTAAGRGTVTIVIPTRDRWSLLRRALRSALAQDAVQIEVFVVDDGSRAPATASGFEELEDRRVEVIRHDRTQGVSAARNAGTQRATSAWITWLDDDDVWAPTRLASLLEAARASEAEFAYSSALVVDDSLRPIRLDGAPAPADVYRLLCSHNAVPGGGSNMLVSASALERCGLFDEDFSFAADWELWLRLAGAARGAALDSPLLAYRIHAESWAIRRDDAVARDLNRVRTKHPFATPSSTPDRLIAKHFWWTGRRARSARHYAVGAWRDRDPRALLRAAGSFLTPTAARGLRLIRPLPPVPGWLANEIAEEP